MKILIVEDDELVLETLKELLQSREHQVATAGNGKEALQVLQAESKFDVLISDIIMPEKEGIETISEAKKIQPALKVIAISGGGRTNNLDFLKLAKKIGADKTLAKPFRNGELIEALDSI
ncbi:MAG: response regulator [Micavibrio sp.]|nr:response regulator [Micavibrio sp.]|tara:strand:- start:1606 stop:1965 length:360 start_codon:yes stop_codon:yes gene_type:complete